MSIFSLGIDQKPPPQNHELAQQSPPTTANDSDTYEELAPQRPTHRKDEGFQVSDRDCILEASDRDCTLEVNNHRVQEIHKEAVAEASGDTEASTLEKAHRSNRSRNCFRENGRIQESRVCCAVAVVVVIIVITIPSSCSYEALRFESIAQSAIKRRMQLLLKHVREGGMLGALITR
ncbi:hypothetical protein BDV32DRAFT_153923 [Aspergillus pseudonomiae]|uniref:Uncharacterized protein n=1 Tax=Aspergillus pseudonomiae TaxID=1506151 RepID=A0A5N7D5G6_9EURO|nr:uncharacterized protein BDV37DRAFT_285560 [Aspergillus pseudonomiae]KAB8255785.1 hypothetical protein BDV32DRAFT_153923 [Aspergillus pseudonomiae]KAE8401539.1 hypothetical protein BDV37DRAFT_285560 [Aspergillus pseudonomiae]